jgi:putative RNA 2'-phosphotransferase
VDGSRQTGNPYIGSSSFDIDADFAMPTEEHNPVPAQVFKISKFLSLILRHEPQKIGLVLDSSGWADVDELIRLCNAQGKNLDRQLLEEVVSTNDKKRFAFSDDGLRIRASQGHSIEIDLALTPTYPPELLYHGTASRFIDSIRATGLNSGTRQHVHLSTDAATATKVGQRHGKPVILTVLASHMSAAGYLFYLSANGVWLTEKVPVTFLQFPDDSLTQG